MVGRLDHDDVQACQPLYKLKQWVVFHSLAHGTRYEVKFSDNEGLADFIKASALNLRKAVPELPFVEKPPPDVEEKKPPANASRAVAKALTSTLIFWFGGTACGFPLAPA